MVNVKSITAGVTVACLLATSCTTVDPYSGETTTSKTAKGAAIGALGGGLLGAVIGKNKSGGSSRKGAIRGAVIGAAAGAGIGYYMDKQEAKIREQLQGTGVTVTRSGNELHLNMPSDITFNVDSSVLKQKFVSTLYSVALVLDKYDKTHIRVVGHTDSDGSAYHNQSLSMARAQSVASYLKQSGVEHERVRISAMGESMPVASNATASGKAKNRRVEIKIEPIEAQF